MSKPSKEQCSNQMSPDDTPKGHLPPLEITKAFAFDVVLRQMEKHMGKSACVLLGEDKGSFIAKNLKRKGGGNPTRFTVFKTIKKCKGKGWHPGMVQGERTGRPNQVSDHQKKEMARVLMATKKELVRPTPSILRAKLPKLTINPCTNAPVSDSFIYNLMHTMCYDESEDDPWIYAYSPAKDFLSDGMKTHRVTTADHVMKEIHAAAWSTHVAIDPCISILARKKAQTDDQKVAAMGIKKMMSKKSKFKGPNCRAPKTTNSQGKDDIRVHWTPVFALGKIYVYVCDAEAAARDPTLPTRLNESSELGKFIKNVLPDILTHMSDAHGWGRTPRTIVHDKASYMVAPRSQRLAGPFADALRAAKMKSWVGDADANCSWLAGRLGDLYPHETAISHIRTGLSRRFPRSTPGETRARFANRMEKVVGYMNSKEFTARDGGGLMALSQSLRDRFSRMKELKGERLRT